MNWIGKLFSYFRFQEPPPKPRRVNTIPPDEERCISTIGTGRPAPNPAPRCKFHRAEGQERCSIHQKIWEKRVVVL